MVLARRPARARFRGLGAGRGTKPRARAPSAESSETVPREARIISEMAPPRFAAFLGFAILASACGDDQDPAGAADLWARIHTANYRGWSRAPGYEERRPSNTAHSDAVDIYLNVAIGDALGATGTTAWPVGSLIVKDGFDDDGDLDLVAAMEKRENGWFWAEWDGDGDASFSGSPELCIDCHRSGSDFVRAFSLPK